MNTLQLLKANPRYQKSLSNYSSQFSQDNSKVTKRKVPQSRLSYLKKLFANNIETQNTTQNNEAKALHQEIRAFEKSKLVRHSDKNLAKYVLRQVPKNYQLQPINRKDNLRYNPINEPQFLPLNQSKNSQITDVNKSFDIRLSNQRQNLDRTRPVLRKQKIESSSRGVNYSQEKATHSLHESPTYSKGKSENMSTVEPQDNRVKKELKELKELRKIERMLDDIKCQILKNRSMIIEGINEIKDFDEKRMKNRTIDPSLFPEELDESYELPQNQRSYVHRQNHIRSVKYSDRQKPMVEYTKCYKLR